MANPNKARSAAYDRFVARTLDRDPELKECSLFGMASLGCSVGGKTKAFCGSFAGGLALRLGEDADEALAIDGATPFDPSGKGRPMRGWVVLPATASRRWSRFAAKARAFVEAG